MEVPPFFTDDHRLAADLVRLGHQTQDPLWQLPLWRGYEDTLNSRIADLNNMEVRVKVNENDVVNVKVHDKATITIDAFPGRTFAGTVTEISSSAEKKAPDDEMRRSCSTRVRNSFIAQSTSRTRSPNQRRFARRYAAA